MATIFRWQRIASLLAAALIACGGGGADSAVPGAPLVADVTLLFMGNSHTHANDVPGLVAALVQAASPGKSVAHALAPGIQFLDERLADPASVALIQRQPWSAAVLQAQRYSSSGTVTYSIAEAIEWVRRARAAGAVPVMFPEWPRRGVDEAARIFALHVSIAQAAPACVPPIPQAFDIALARNPGLVLHAADGNHSAPAGALLAAMLIAHTLTGLSPAAMPTQAQSGVDKPTQALLRTAATLAAQATSPWQWCPNDRPR